jgi:adenine-specific DNA-methyltransferase
LLAENVYKSSQDDLEMLDLKDIFSFPKPVSLIELIVRGACDDQDIVLDFFAGSCTTAHAVLNISREMEKKLYFIMIQLPEPLDHDTFSTIADFGRERIQRVTSIIKKDNQGMSNPNPGEDLGFKSYQLDHSNFKSWQPYTGNQSQQLETLFDRFETPLVDSWQPQNLLTEILLLQGFPLDSRIITLDAIQGNFVKRIHAEGVAHELFVCLDEKVNDETIQQLHLRAEDIFVCLDSTLSDKAKIRLADQCNLKVI